MLRDCCKAAKAIFCSMVGLWLTSCGDPGPRSTADGWGVKPGEFGQDCPLSISLSLSDEVLGDCVPVM